MMQWLDSKKNGLYDVTVVLDGQYGSCGKGAFAQHLAAVEQPDLAVRTGGPNAGHSVLLRDVKSGEWSSLALRHVPAAAVANTSTLLALPPTALISPGVLASELQALSDYGVSLQDRFFIDPLATIITHEDEEAESGMRERIGSTREGVGAAQARKVMRTATLARDVDWLKPYIRSFRDVLGDLGNGDSFLRDGSYAIHIEMTQGVGLGLHFGHYPFATSRDIHPAQALADLAFPVGDIDSFRVMLLARSFPIRVAGNSGPFGGQELTWEEIEGRTRGWVKAEDPEKTTVTKLPRRIAEWSNSEIKDALAVCGARTDGVLMFADYLFPDDLRGVLGVSKETSSKDLPLGWHADPAIMASLKELTVRLMNEGEFDEYRQPFWEYQSDIRYVSWGFGAIVEVF